MSSFRLENERVDIMFWSLSLQILGFDFFTIFWLLLAYNYPRVDINDLLLLVVIVVAKGIFGVIF